MFMVTFRHGEDVDKNVSNSDVNSDDGFITLLSDSKFDKKKTSNQVRFAPIFIGPRSDHSLPMSLTH